MYTTTKLPNINILFFFCLIFSSIPLYANYLFISSAPLGAKVSIEVTDKDSKKFVTIGKTPLKTTNFSANTRVLVEKGNYFVSTNTIKKSTQVQSCFFNLVPLTFDVTFPNQDNAVFYANKQHYTPLDGVLALPFGNYNVAHDFKKNTLAINYKSPYIPYIAFFSSVTILSTIMAITGGVLANQYYQDYLNASSGEELIASMGKVSTWDTVTWSSVGIGTGALIGTIITTSLDAKDRKRIKRFNGLNTSAGSVEYMADYQNILLAITVDSDDVLKKINAFIKKYSATDTSVLADVYFRRSGIYFNQTKQNNRAIADLKIVIEKLPSKRNYELATKLLADIYMNEQKYSEAYENYSEAIRVADIFTYSELKTLNLEALYNMALDNPKKYKTNFLDESQAKQLKGLSKEDQDTISTWRIAVNQL